MAVRHGSYLASSGVARDCCSLLEIHSVSSKLCFFHPEFARAFRPLSSMFRFIPPLFVLAQHDLNLGAAVASWLVRSSPDRGVRVRALARDIVLCSWARHFTLTVPLSTQVYKWVPANLMLGVTLRWTSIPSRVE